MLSHLGLLLLCFSFSLSLLASVQLIAVYIASPNNHWSARTIQYLVWSSFLAVTASMAMLAWSFYSNDFTNAYVAAHSNSQLPWFFRLAAVWGGHEGSMLFWVWVVHFWATIISTHSTNNTDYLKQTLLLMMSIGGVLCVFVLAFSNPFELQSMWVSEGRDLNPMLQDVALIIHPPLLYVGYVGFSAPFAAACIAVWNGQISTSWFSLIRIWALVSWAFLTGGIALGAWWAYYELGWGGWWFWDPVENASLLPWLTATALIHSLFVVKRHVAFPVVALALCFVTFSLSLLGTFIVRSGVLTSVHAFAVDPSKGVVLIGLSVLVLLMGAIPLVLNAERLTTSHSVRWTPLRLFLLTSVGLLVLATMVVLLGTFYPMIFQILGLGSISVGAPYFNTLFSIICAAGLIALCLHLVTGIAYKHKGLMGASLYICGLVLSYSAFGFTSYASILLLPLTFCAAVLLTLQLKARTHWVSYIAHMAILMLVAGSIVYEGHSYQVNRKVSVGESTDLIDYTLSFDEKRWLVGPNYTALEGRFSIVDNVNSNSVYELTPQKRHYQVRVMNMSEPAIASLWHGDLYLSLGNKLADGSYIIKFQYKAGMSFVWIAAIMLVIAAILRLYSAITVPSQIREQT